MIWTVEVQNAFEIDVHNLRLVCTIWVINRFILENLDVACLLDEVGFWMVLLHARKINGCPSEGHEVDSCHLPTNRATKLRIFWLYTGLSKQSFSLFSMNKRAIVELVLTAWLDFMLLLGSMDIRIQPQIQCQGSVRRIYWLRWSVPTRWKMVYGGYDPLLS